MTTQKKNTPLPGDLAGMETAMLNDAWNKYQQQYSEGRLLSPTLLKYVGLKPTVDASGNVTGVTNIPETDIPVSGGTLRDWAEAEDTMKNRLASQVPQGGWMSAAGPSQTWNDFQKAKLSAFGADRQGTMQQRLGDIMGIAGFPYGASSAGSAFQNTASALGNQAASANNLDYYKQLANAQSLGGIFGGVGSLLGGGAGLASNLTSLWNLGTRAVNGVGDFLSGVSSWAPGAVDISDPSVVGQTLADMWDVGL